LNRAGRFGRPPIVAFKTFILTESGFVPVFCVRQINISLSVSDSCEVSEANHHHFRSTTLSGRVLAMIGQSFIVIISDYVVLLRFSCWPSSWWKNKRSVVKPNLLLIHAKAVHRTFVGVRQRSPISL